MTADARPMSRKIQARVFRVVNVPMRFVLGLPFATPLGSRLMLISYQGRNSGKAYRQPVSFVRDADVLLTPGGGKWKLNLASGAPIRIRLNGRDLSARPELVRDPDEVERLLSLMAAKNPSVQRFVAIPSDSEGHLDRTSLNAAIEHGFCIVRWHLIDDRRSNPHQKEAPQ
jgi:hypothetical protein